MEWIRPVSASVEALGYDPGTETLEVAWSNGRRYHFFNVPRGVFEWLRTTPTPGAFINRMVIGRYREERVQGSRAPGESLERLLVQTLEHLRSPGDAPTEPDDP